MLTHLQHIYASSRDVADNLILVVEMTSEHLCRLVHGVLNLDGDATACLRLLHHLWNTQ